MGEKLINDKRVYIQQNLKKIICKIVGNDKFTSEDFNVPISKLELDSLNMFQIIVEIEEVLNLEIDDEKIYQINTFDDLVSLILLDL